MNGTTIICPNCKSVIEISDAIQHQIEDELQRAKSEQSEVLRKEMDALAEKQIQDAVSSAVAEAQLEAKRQLDREKQNAAIELEQAKQTTELEVLKARQTTEFELKRLRLESDNSKENEKQLREQLASLIEDLSKANKAREDAELSARRELLEKEKLIREEATKRASDDFNIKIREQEETINKLREQLTTAKQVAEQGSQQLQGEILELDIEQNLRNSFPFDTIIEVKKGERGSDIRQVVNEKLLQNCGLILWECKNTKIYRADWLSKLKDELAIEKAQFGVIVFNPTDGGGDDFERLADNVWLVKPRYAMMLAAFLREVCIKVFVANKNAEGKDVKIEMIYNYLTGGEFSNRIRYIIESYDEMAKQLETEKKQAHRRWSAQEKILQKVTTSLHGMSGDLIGISGMDIIALSDDLNSDDNTLAENSPIPEIDISLTNEDEF